jgi:hypothetical protein
MKVKDKELLRGLDRTHPLIRPLQEGEDPAQKNPLLLQHLNVATYEQAAQKMAEILFPGYRADPKRDKHRRPQTSTMLLKAAGLPTAGITAGCGRRDVHAGHESEGSVPACGVSATRTEAPNLAAGPQRAYRGKQPRRALHGDRKKTNRSWESGPRRP